MLHVVDFILHVDRHLSALIADMGPWTYVILFLIIFCETGLVVTPFLPGDSLIFAAGALTASTILDVNVLFVVLAVAAVSGDALNYVIGRYIGPRVMSSRSRLIRREHLERTHLFFERHGGKTIVMARFIPIVRTFAPFVAGIGDMHYLRFASFNVTGGLLWVGLFAYGGHFFGNIPAVKNNFSLVIVAIIALSLVPPVLEYLRSRFSGAAGQG